MKLREIGKQDSICAYLLHEVGETPQTWGIEHLDDLKGILL